MGDKEENEIIDLSDKKLPRKIFLCYGFGHMLNDLTSSMWFSYLLVFFHYAMNLNNSLCGLLMLIGQIADGIATPIIGILSDKGEGHWLCKYGHRKTWHLIGTFCVAVSFPFIFSPCLFYFENMKTEILIFYYSIFIVIFQFGWASGQVSHLSLVPDLTPNQDERTSLITIRYSFTVFANIMIHLFTWFLFHKNGNSLKNGTKIVDSQDADKFQIVALFAIAAGLIFSLLFHTNVSEQSNISSLVKKNASDKINKCSIIGHYSLYHIMGLYMMSQLYVNQSQVFMPLYLEEYLNVEAQRLPILPLTMYISSSVSSILAKTLNTRYGRKVAYIVGAALAIVICIVVFFGKDIFYKTYTIYVVVAIFGSASSIISVSCSGITADLIGEHTSQGAFVYGLMSFGDKISNGSVVMIIQYLKFYFTTNNYYRDMLILTCGGSVSIGLLLIIFLPQDFKLSYEKKSEMRNNNTGSATTIVYCMENDKGETNT